LFLKIWISYIVFGQPEAMSGHELQKVHLQHDVRTSSSHVRMAISLCSQHVQTAQRMQVTVRSCSLTCSESPTDATSRKSLFWRCLDIQDKAVDTKKFSCKYPDTRVTCPETLHIKFTFWYMSRHCLLEIYFWLVLRFLKPI
jgi:hypothetical protein